MEVILFIMLCCLLALQIVTFIEIEHICDNQLQIWNDINRINRRLIFKKGKK